MTIDDLGATRQAPWPLSSDGRRCRQNPVVESAEFAFLVSPERTTRRCISRRDVRRQPASSVSTKGAWNLLLAMLIFLSFLNYVTSIVETLELDLSKNPVRIIHAPYLAHTPSAYMSPGALLLLQPFERGNIKLDLLNLLPELQLLVSNGRRTLPVWRRMA